jgi:hypothetical protein
MASKVNSGRDDGGIVLQCSNPKTFHSKHVNYARDNLRLRGSQVPTTQETSVTIQATAAQHTESISQSYSSQFPNMLQAVVAMKFSSSVGCWQTAEES